MKFEFLIILLLITKIGYSGKFVFEPGDSVLLIKRCADFVITGKGDNKAWEATTWSVLGKKVDAGGKNYGTQFKMIYADKGIYLLFRGEDEKVTTKNYKDFEEIYEGDVYEVFFHPDPAVPLYFEYEINPMGRELILTLA
ncbi:MAG TPA: carbohydrate-binding family 9-like protein, partial [Flavitalea sp.]|nr:carbohydrate-binding family 9-like protein [Flavitalea sp.]